jgi:hypothetical protein
MPHVKRCARIAPLGNDTHSFYMIHTYTLCAFRPGHIIMMQPPPPPQVLLQYRNKPETQHERPDVASRSLPDQTPLGRPGRTTSPTGPAVEPECPIQPRQSQRPSARVPRAAAFPVCSGRAAGHGVGHACRVCHAGLGS